MLFWKIKTPSTYISLSLLQERNQWQNIADGATNPIQSMKI